MTFYEGISMKLVIFDLDQTLVDLINIHDKVTQTLFKGQFGVDARLTDIDFTGKSLLDNFKELARLKKIERKNFDAKSSGLLGKYEDIFEKAIPADGSRYVLPGARELLSGLKRANQFIVLYTGGSRRIGEAVLRITGLKEYFELRFYGTEVKERLEMVQMAIRQAERISGRKFKGKDVVIIGDSIRDVDCAGAIDGYAIAVATGFHSLEQLKERGADLVVDSLRDWEKLVSIITSRK